MSNDHECGTHVAQHGRADIPGMRPVMGRMAILPPNGDTAAEHQRRYVVQMDMGRADQHIDTLRPVPQCVSKTSGLALIPVHFPVPRNQRSNARGHVSALFLIIP